MGSPIRSMLRQYVALVVLLLMVGITRAEMTLDAFLSESFGGAAPPSAMLWLTPAVKQRVVAILGHDYPGLRVKYWRKGERTAWVLDEVGKEQPITMGVVVEQGQILNVEVLAYRESRGGEVRQGFFRQQFMHARLAPGDRLSQPIDGITGATLSVGAMTRVARVALALHDVAVGGH
ncbi:MAG TPA: FMN-binding protein [Moraxellaceae bacterium]|nr:FMN-binding protein [Moraxellaceae bacterium]